MPLSRFHDRRARRLRILAALSLTSAVPCALALQPLITDDTGTQGSGGNQIELALNRQREHSGGDTTTYWSVPAVYTRGLTDALDIYVGGNWQRIRSSAPDADTEGNGNPLLGIKWRFWEDTQRGLSLGLKPELQFKVSDEREARGLGSGRTGYGIALLATQETGFGAVHVNLAGSRVRYASADNVDFHRKHLYRFSVAPVFEISEQWRLAIDAGVTTHPHRSESRTMGYLEVGTIWSPSKDLDLALGYIAARHDGQQRVRTLTAGTTWRFR